MANESANAVNALPNVNLLPYHAERRAGKRKKVFMSLGGAAVAGGPDGVIASVIALAEGEAAAEAQRGSAEALWAKFAECGRRGVMPELCATYRY